MSLTPSNQIDVSVVVPAYNEAENLIPLTQRIRKTLDGHYSWEMHLVLDGCTDNSLDVALGLLDESFPLEVLDLGHGFGQHPAIWAALPRARGDYVVTLDADLQNPPEAIPDIIRRLKSAYDGIGTIRLGRRDTAGRRTASALFRTTLDSLGFRHHVADPGCMLRGWRRTVVEAFLNSGREALYLPLQLNEFCSSYADFETEHFARAHGTSHYPPRALLHLLGRVVALKIPGAVTSAPPPTPVSVYRR